MKLGGRKSTNVIDDTQTPVQPTKTAINSKMLDNTKSINSYTIPKGQRTGTLEPGMDDDSYNGTGTDYPFFKHTQKDNM